MPPAVERFNAIRARSIEADSLRVGGQDITAPYLTVPSDQVKPMASDCGIVEVRGEAEIRPNLAFVACAQATISGATKPLVPGLQITVELDSHAGTITLRAWKTSGNGLSVVPASEPVFVHWLASGA